MALHRIGFVASLLVVAPGIGLVVVAEQLGSLSDQTYDLLIESGGALATLFAVVGCVPRSHARWALVPAALASALLTWATIDPGDGINLTSLYLPPVVAVLGALGAFALADRAFGRPSGNAP